MPGITVFILGLTLPWVVSLAANFEPVCAPAGLVDEVLPDWVATLSYDAIPEAVVMAAKDALLDTLAVAWAGPNAEGLEPVLDYVQRDGVGPCSLWGHQARLSATAAALGNGLLASALDFDIVQEEAVAHSHIVVVPALFALAEFTGASGKDFVTAHVAGCEMASRLGLAVQTQPGWYYSSVISVLAAAAACARLLGLDFKGVRAAVGVALSRAAGSQQAMIEGSFTKRLQTAFAARDAVEAALLAQLGVDGPSRMLTGRAGFEALYTPMDWDSATRDLGSDWHFQQATYKNFPSCFCNHAAIIAAQGIAGRLLTSGEIDRCSVRIPAFSARLVGAPFEPGANPQVSAQFSVRYSVANALLRGGLDLVDISCQAVLDPEVLALTQRIEVRVDEDAPGRYTPATVEVQLSTGEWRTVTVATIPGTPAEPLTREQRLAKARQCFMSGSAAMTAERFDRLVERIDGLDGFSSLLDFWQLDGSVS